MVVLLSNRESEPNARSLAGGRLKRIGLGVLIEGGLALLALALGFVFSISLFQLINPDTRSLLAGVAGALVLGLAVAGLAMLPFAPVRRLFALMREFYGNFFGQAGVPELALLSLAAGAGEEFFFRGFLQTALQNLGGPWFAISVAAILFGMAHWITATYAITATFSGLLLGWLFYYTGDLSAPVLAHALYDFLALLYLRSTMSQRPAPTRVF